jgi:RNA polymerase sigma-70 factor (sigma-E family)
VTFEEFVADRARALIGLGTAMSGDAHLAEDIVQDVLLKAHQRWSKISALNDPYSYVRRMVTNEYLSWRRKWSRIVPFAEVDIFSDAPDHATTHADRSALMEQLRTLTRRQRAVLALRFYDGLGDAQIAETLGCSEGAVRSYASRALARLRADSESLLPSSKEKS